MAVLRGGRFNGRLFLLGVMMGLICSQAAVCGEAAPAPEPATAAQQATDTGEADAHLPWLVRLWNHVTTDFAQRFSIRQWAVVIRHLFDSLLIILVANLAVWLIHRFVQRLGARIERLHGAIQRRKVDTITSLVFSTFKYAVYIVSVLWILGVWGVDTQSLVVGSAVIAAAIGFGSQGLVQDVITGLSILAEEQLAVGDFVEIAGKSGAVEEIGLRVVKLRDPLGVQHVIFNRTIAVVSNYTSGGIQALVDVSLANMEAAEPAKHVAAQVCKDLAAESPYFTRVPEVEGVHQSSTHDVFLRLKLRVLPQQDAAIQNVFVDRLKRAFEREKIEIPEGRVRIIVLSDLFSKAISKVEPSALP